MSASTATTAAAVKPFESEALAYAGLVSATLCWAAAFIAGKLVLAEMTPLVAASCRYGIAALVLLPFAARRGNLARARPVIAPLALMTACGGVLYPFLFFSALSRTSATNTALLVALNPVFTVLLAPIVGERLTARRLGGVGLALAGAVTVITHGQVRHLAEISLHSGDLFAVAGALTWATFNLASRGTVTHLPSSFINFVVYGLGGVALGLLGAGEAPWQQISGASSVAIGALLVLAVFSSVLAGQFFLGGVRTFGVGRTVVFVYLVPVLTAGLATVLLGESFELPQAIGGAAVLLGVYVTTRPATARS